MTSKLPFILIGMGVIIAGVSWLGYQNVNRPSDIEIMQDYRAEQARISEESAQLMHKVLPIPPSCNSITVKPVFDICEAEPREGTPWPNWLPMATVEEQICLLDAFHQTNAHAFAILRKTYESVPPTNEQMGEFACDVFGGVLWAEGLNTDDPTQSVTGFIVGYYQDRSESDYDADNPY